jgi:hypothetical protein
MLKVSKETDAAAQEKQFEMQFKIEYVEHTKGVSVGQSYL